MDDVLIEEEPQTLETLADLKPAEYNPRTITEDAFARLQHSLSSFGDIGGIVWNKRTGRLVTGHQRIQALKDVHGADLRLEGDSVVTPDGVRFEVRVVDWDELTEKAANIAANSSDTMGEFNPEGLANIIQELGEFAVDLDLLCLSPDSLVDIIAVLDQNSKALEPAVPNGSPSASYSQDTFVLFRFGDYQGQVRRGIYDSFKAHYKKYADGHAESVLLDDILAAWLLEDESYG